MDALTKIVLTGPESSGKSWLAQKLAGHFKTLYAPEYARLYLEKHGPHYDYALLGKLAKEHLKHQQNFLSRARNLIFLDTDLINYRVWEKLVYGKVHPFIEEALEKENEHRYLITYPDIPWKPDPLRENPSDRLAIFNHHLGEINERKRPYRVVKGYAEKRLMNAIEAVEELLIL